MSFKNKVVIITGASSGIGAAAAILFVKEGANVVMVGRNETKLKNVSEQLPKTVKHLVLKADVAADAKRIINETVKTFGKIDVLVNNAGFAKMGSLTEGNFLEAYDDIMNVNVRAVIELTMLAIPHLKETKGNIVNISSVVAKTLPLSNKYLAYAVSKAALDHFSKGTAKELAPFGIRVNVVNPGPVRTDFLENANINASYDDFGNLSALNRVSNPEEVADLIMYLAGDKAIGITGSTFVCDNGYLLGNPNKN